MPDPRRRFGALGEELVAAWYARSGFVVLDRNWRIARGEIDLVAASGGLLVFCEVKTRTSSRFGSGLEAVTQVKQRRLRSLGLAWIEAHGYRQADVVRFDVAAITGREVTVVVDAF